MTSTTSADPNSDQSTEVLSDPWSEDWDVPTRDELESRHDSVRRHQREGKIPSRRVSQAHPPVDPQNDQRANRDRRQGDRRVNDQADRRLEQRTDQEWQAEYRQSLDEDESSPPV